MNFPDKERSTNPPKAPRKGSNLTTTAILEHDNDQFSTNSTMLITFSVLLLPFLGWLLAIPIYRRLGRWVGWWSTFIALFTFVLTLIQLHLFLTNNGEPLYFSWTWLPYMGVNFSFFVDGLSLFFALLITGIGAIVLGYSNFYLSVRENLGRFHALMLLFMGSIPTS